MKTRTLLAAGIAVLLAVPALAQNGGEKWHENDSGRQACLQLGRVWNWTAPDNRTLIVENDVHKKFKIELLGACTGLRFTQRLGFRSLGGSYISCITPGDTIFFHDVGMETRCAISKISAYTPQMEEADKKAKEMKEKK